MSLSTCSVCGEAREFAVQGEDDLVYKGCEDGGNAPPGWQEVSVAQQAGLAVQRCSQAPAQDGIVPCAPQAHVRPRHAWGHIIVRPAPILPNISAMGSAGSAPLSCHRPLAQECSVMTSGKQDTLPQSPPPPPPPRRNHQGHGCMPQVLLPWTINP